MLTLRLKKLIPDEEAEKWLVGTLLGEDSYDTLIREDADVLSAETGEVLARFRVGALPVDQCASAYRSLRDAAVPSANRGTAAGTFEDGAEIGKQIAERSKTRYRRLKKDGTLTNTNEAKIVDSGIVGFFDRNPRNPYCRQTAYTMQHGDRFEASLPLIATISDKFAELMPERWAAQKEYVDRTSSDFVIPGTVFTTVTVNKNFQTAVHKDAGDLKAGFGVLTALRAGRYDGGYFVLPQWRVAFDIHSTDLLLCDVHQFHGNTPVRGRSPRYERVSLVLYYREKMALCGSAAQELERAKRRASGGSLYELRADNESQSPKQ